MSWELSKLEHLRMEFVLIAREPFVSVSEVCRQFGISRKTGYKWLNRYKSEGLGGLSDRSRRPHMMPLAVSGDVVVALVRLRQEHPFWGPKKLRSLLSRQGIRVDQIPSIATVGRILNRSGLSETKGRGRPRRYQPRKSLTAAITANNVWTVDFKGWWRCKDGSRCEPLTIRDLYSRYLLCVRPMRTRKTEAVKDVFEELFRRYGLPEVIRSDNGTPFASVTGLYGMTRLSAWWRSLGITHDRIELGHPEQNGAHERMHGDIAREIEGTPSLTLEKETERLEHWRIEYNVQRPHEALGMKTPGECYQLSSRRFENVPVYIYPREFEVRRVRPRGFVKLKSKCVYISEALGGLSLGLQRITEEHWRVWFNDVELGEIDFTQGSKLWPTAAAYSKKHRSCNPCPDN